jgi:hypothetical protein
MMKQAFPLFSPDHIISLIKEQHPQRQDLIRAMKRCSSWQWESPAYVYFVNRSRPNEEGSNGNSVKALS